MDGAEAARIMYGQGGVMSKSRLKAVKPEETRPSKPKILVYGKPGAGKTFTSMDFPSCYFIDTEGGATRPHYMDKLKKAGGVYFGIEHGSLDFANVIEQVKALATEKHEYKTLIIDSATKLFNNEVAKEADRLGDKDAFGASKKPATSKMRQLIAWLQRIDMNVIIICHEKVLWGILNGQRAEMGVTFDCYEKLEYELDLSLNIIKLPGNKRNAVIKKTRLESFPEGDVFEWSYESFAKRFGREVIEKDSANLELATDQQIEEIKRLVDLLKLPDNQIDKWLTAANADSWESMDSDKLEKVIIHIKTKIIKTNMETN